MYCMNQNYGAVMVENKIIGKMCVYGCLKASITNCHYGDIVIVRFSSMHHHRHSVSKFGSCRPKQSYPDGILNHYKKI